MENHIYPLNIEEPTPLGSKSKRKKPSFKEWVKERKKMVVFVCAIAILALATVAIYATGLSDKLLGLIYDENGEEIVTFADQEGTKITAPDIKVLVTQPKGGETLEYPYSYSKHLVKIINTGTKDAYYKARIDDDFGTVTSHSEKIFKSSLSAVKIGDFDTIPPPEEYTITVKIFQKESDMKDDPEDESYISVQNFSLTIEAEPAAPPEITTFSLTATPKGTQEVGEESSFSVEATGGTPPYDFSINYGDNLYNYYNKVKIPSLTIKHTYSKAGTYTVSAKVTDSLGEIENKSIEKYVITAPLNTIKPIAIDLNPSGLNKNITLPDKILPSPEISTFTLAASPKNGGEAGQGSYFFVKATGGTPPYKFHIDYDDNNFDNATGNEAGQYTFKHTYSKAGNYKITAEVTDSFGKTKITSIPEYAIIDTLQDTKITYETKTEPLDYIANKDIKQEIAVKNPAVILSLTGTPASPSLAGTEVTFKLEATAGATSYNFRIEYGLGEGGDVNAGSKSNIATFKHKYEKAGTYTVSAGVTSTLNVNDPVHKEITYQITETKTEAVVPPPPVVTEKQCSNGKDDDGDDKVDYEGIIGKVKDPGCESKDDNSENSDAVVTPPPPPNNTPEPPLTAKETKCDDGKDNDKDGKIDYEDSDCKAPKDASIKITEVGVTSQKLNPALNAVKIYYKLSDSANVKVEMKNAKGDVTVPLFEGKQMKQVGNFSVWWEGTLDNKPNGQKAPDGTYTYKISATHLKYPDVKDSKEGTITVDSTYNPGGLDFEDVNNANLVGDTTQGQNKGQGAGQTPSTPITPSQNQATVAIQSATTGSTAGTGPGVVIYFLFPLFAYAYKKIKY